VIQQRCFTRFSRYS